jgi:hypothetical protein
LKNENRTKKTQQKQTEKEIEKEKKKRTDEPRKPEAYE